MCPNLHETVNLVTFTEGIRYEKRDFLFSVSFKNKAIEINPAIINFKSFFYVIYSFS